MKLTTLRERRLRGDLIETFKIVNGLVEYGYGMFRLSRSNKNTIRNAINIVLGHNNIKLVREIKFLGVIIDDKLSWKPHTKYLNLNVKLAVKYDETCYS